MNSMKKQYVYILKPNPHLLKAENWTNREEQIVANHFAYLQKAQAEGQLVLAGKTDGLDEETFGLVIFEADSMEQAVSFMNDDPAVFEGVMTAKLYPYRVALMKQ